MKKDTVIAILAVLAAFFLFGWCLYWLAKNDLIMIIKNKNIGINTEDVNTCTNIVTLKEWMQKVTDDIISMDIQISKAKANYIKTGEYADPGWYSKITSAKKLQGGLKQQIQRRISILKTQDRALCEFIVDAVKPYFDKEEWIDIIAKAKAEKETWRQ